MLKNVDLSKRITKKDYKEMYDELQIRMGELQRKAWKMDIPIIVVFEGWHACGMTEIINSFLLTLNPMGYDLYTTSKPCKQEEERPLLWRFWTKIPKKGRITIFDRSWYRRIVVEKNGSHINKNNMKKCLYGLTYFERQLTDDGYLLLKFFLHISKDEQEKRYHKHKKMDIPLFIAEDEEQEYLNKYSTYLPVIESILERTDRTFAPWTVVESDDNNFATIKILAKFIEAVEYKINDIESELKTDDIKHSDTAAIQNNIKDRIPNIDASILERIYTSKSITKKEYKKEKKKYQKRIEKLQYELFRHKIPMIIVFEGWDASGKGGSIKRLVQKMNPRLYRVFPVAAPSDVEIAHHYLWRFYNDIPQSGHIGIYDRSWYGRVLVERVEELCSVNEWKRAYGEINEFEEILTSYGTVIVKFWMHIDKKEQLERFKTREMTPHKKWKITQDDWRNRQNWDSYMDAANEMLQKTNTSWAPWNIIESNDKYYARIKVMRTVIEYMEEHLNREGFQ